MVGSPIYKRAAFLMEADIKLKPKLIQPPPWLPSKDGSTRPRGHTLRAKLSPKAELQTQRERAALCEVTLCELKSGSTCCERGAAFSSTSALAISGGQVAIPPSPRALASEPRPKTPQDTAERFRRVFGVRRLSQSVRENS